MANERQFFRDIQPGDVSVEGRQANGITAGADGSIFLYSGVKKDELDALTEQNYNGTVSIDGYKGNIIAILKGNQTVPFPEGNNNNETYFEEKQIDPNKIIVATTLTPTPTPIPNPSQTITPTPTPTPTPNLSKENKPPEPAPELEFLPEDDLLAQASAQIITNADLTEGFTPVDKGIGLIEVAKKGLLVKAPTTVITTSTGEKREVSVAGAAGTMAINAVDKRFVDTYTNGVFPATQDANGNLIIKEKKDCYNSFYTNPEYIKDFETVNVPLAVGSINLDVHKTFAAKLKPAMEEIKRLGYNAYIKSSAGTFNVRTVKLRKCKFTTQLSKHAYGFAIDINSDINGWKNGDSWDLTNKKIKSSAGTRDYTDFDKGFLKVVEVMNKYGIGWFASEDPMHFSYGESSKLIF